MTESAVAPATILVGGVSELFQSDLDLGRLAIERLQREELGAGVVVEELHYGAVAVAQRLEDLDPAALILISAVRRGRLAGTVQRRRIDHPQMSPATIQAAVGDAVTGYVHPDLVVEIAAALGVLPIRTVTVEVEPEIVGPGEGLSACATAALESALNVVRSEARRTPLHLLAADLNEHAADDRLSPFLTETRQLLQELVRLDREGHWGQTFTLRDRLRASMANSHRSDQLDQPDWNQWLALIEELDRQEAEEATPN